MGTAALFSYLPASPLPAMTLSPHDVLFPLLSLSTFCHSFLCFALHPAQLFFNILQRTSLSVPPLPPLSLPFLYSPIYPTPAHSYFLLSPFSFLSLIFPMAVYYSLFHPSCTSPSPLPLPSSTPSVLAPVASLNPQRGLVALCRAVQGHLRLLTGSHTRPWGHIWPTSP